MVEVLAFPLLAGLSVAVVMGPLGSFVVWRRMAYFGDALAHSALLGVAAGFALGIDATAGVVAVCLSVALLLALMRRQRGLAEDTLLGILAHGTLSLGMVAIALIGTMRVDLMGYLFGDILAVDGADLATLAVGGAGALAALAWLWRGLLAVTVHEELARVEGVRVGLVQVGYTLLIALVIALAMKVVGILLVTSLLIVPAAAARRLARTPEEMALTASLAGCAAVALGLAGSYVFDIPTGPAIVVAAVCLFALSGPVAALRPAR